MLNEALPVLMRVTELGLTSLSTVTRWLGLLCELVSEASLKGSEHLYQMRLQHINKASPKEEGHLSTVRGANPISSEILRDEEVEALAEAFYAGGGCKSYQVSGQVICEVCDLIWDVNDPDPPGCKQFQIE